MLIDDTLKPADLEKAIKRFWEVSEKKIQLIDREYDRSLGSPVYTRAGKYTTRGWTEWTEGFRYGSQILQFDATGEKEHLAAGRDNTLRYMAPHLTHYGVHDHGFNNVSTYGNLLRLMREKKTEYDEWAARYYELALKLSGAVQAMRWTEHKNGGFIYSFNGPHSLFVDTIRSCRSLVLSHSLGHVLMGEGDRRINLLERAFQHMRSTAEYSVYYGENRDTYDDWGRTVHESIFNVNDGAYRCPNAQQGYSGYTTWTRGLSWAMCGFPEQLEYLNTVPDEELEPLGGRETVESVCLKAARATCDFFIANTPTDGVCYWDCGAPNLYRLGDYLNKPADPFNEWEPVDSTASAIGAQGLLRLGHYLRDKGDTQVGDRYFQAGLSVVKTLLEEPYLSTDPSHQGLLLHSIYHRPNGWDYTPEENKVHYGESSMWGDYHIRELVLLAHRLAADEPYYTFFNCLP